MRRLRILALILVLAWIVSLSGKFLVVDEPEKSDAILVLAGETDRRAARALDLLDQGYAGRVILDVPARARIYQWTLPELAEKWAAGLPQAKAITICETQGLSTKAEARDAAACLQKAEARRVLLVTSDYHTRRALSTFRTEVPGYTFSVASASDPAQFGVYWWRHREWAKTALYEWLRWGWWELVDRWI